MTETWDAMFRDTTRFWVQFVFVPIVVVIGVLGNVITIHILTRKRAYFSSKFYLLALTTSDLCFLLLSFSLTWKHYDCMKSIKFYWDYVPFGLWITDALGSTSVWLTVAFTIERYVAICHPMLTKSYSYSMKHRSAIISIFVCISCFLLTASTSFEWKVVAFGKTKIRGTTLTIFNLENTALGKNGWYRLIYRCISSVLFVILPLLILAVGNFFLIGAVRSSQKLQQNLVSCYAHRRMAQKMRQKDRITINLIIITLIFFICQLPTAIILVYTSLHTPLKDSVEENVLLGLGNLFNLLIAINADCNFLMYTAISEKYRRSLFRLFCMNSIMNWWKSRKRNGGVLCKPEVRSIDEQIRSSMVNNKFCNDYKEGYGKKFRTIFKDSHSDTVVILRKCTTCEAIKCGRQCASDDGAMLYHRDV